MSLPPEVWIGEHEAYETDVVHHKVALHALVVSCDSRGDLSPVAVDAPVHLVVLSLERSPVASEC